MTDWLSLAGLWLLIWVGHACIWTYGLNVLYGCKIPKRILKPWRLVSFVLIVFGWPIYFLLSYLAHGPDPIPWQFGVVLVDLDGSIVYWYSRLCIIFGIGFAIWSIIRLLLPRAASLVRESTVTLDLVREVGPTVYGRGKWWWLARLPFTCALKVDFTELTLRIPKLPAEWDGLTILHLTDLHFHGTPDRPFFERVFAECQSRWPVPDLLCLTGDYVDTDQHHDWIGPLLGPLPATVGRFAILGNHDELHRPEAVRTALTEAGYKVVGNSEVTVTVRGLPLTIIGHEGPWFKRSTTVAKPETPSICLSHSPDNAIWASELGGCLLTLAGHVHGGQIRLPIIGPIFIPSTHSRRFDQGVFDVKGMPLVVGRGLSGKEPIRFRCHPQVIRIVLTRGESGA